MGGDGFIKTKNPADLSVGRVLKIRVCRLEVSVLPKARIFGHPSQVARGNSHAVPHRVEKRQSGVGVGLFHFGAEP